MNKLRSFFAAAPHVERLPDEEVARRYPRFRWSILEATFLGYATYYLVRNNLSVVAKEMQGALSYDHSMIGSILAATAISYGIGKLFMGSLSDRSNPRVFMACGLLATAVINVIFGSVTSYPLHLLLWALNGFVQGMGWAPCGRSMGHWFSLNERGTMFSIWNTSHNLGGGIAGVLAAEAASHFDWRYAFYFPAAIALVGAIYLFARLRDTPQSVGLPPIEEYRDDFPEDESQRGAHEEELSTRTLFVDHVLKNKYIWVLAFANFFAYVVRYSMLDWGPLYLREVKGASLSGGGIAVLAIEFGGIPSTIALGWLSDKLGGRRGMVSVLCMIPIFCAFWVIILNPPGRLWLDMTMLAVIGCFIYPVLNLITIGALDLTSKKAIGTAAGFIGLFGYIGRTVMAKGFGATLKSVGDAYGIETGWLVVLYSIQACTVIAILLLALTWRIKPKA